MAAKATWRSDADFDSVSDKGDKLPRMSDLVEVAKYPDKEWLGIRTIGPVTSVRTHWVKFKSKAGKIVEFGKPCLAFDRLKGELDSTLDCPYCELDKERARASTEYYVNAIIRDLQEDEPAKKGVPTKLEAKSGFKEKGSKSWTPVRAVRFPAGVAGSVKKLKELNKHKVDGAKTAFPISHVEYGCDIMIQFDKDGDGSKKYTVQKGDASAITDEEAEYLLWDIQQDIPMEDIKSAKAEVARILKSFGQQDEDEYHDSDLDDDADEDDEPKSKKAKPAAKSKKVVDEDDDLDEDDEPTPKFKAKAKSKPAEDEDDFDEDEAPAKKSKQAKAKPAEDEDDDFDDEPAPKAKSKAKAKPADEDDFDEDDEPVTKPKGKAKAEVEEDEDDFDDEPTPKAKAKAKAKGKAKAKPAEDEDDDDFDEDEAPAKKPAKGKSKPANDDLDDDEDEAPAPKAKAKKKVVEDEDEDDDFDDEPVAKKAAPKSKKKVVEDDDDFDD